jgi:hypothetical protein
MRKLLISLACLAAAVPAVALAAEQNFEVGGQAPPSSEKRIEAKARAEAGQRVIERRAERAERRREHRRGGATDGGAPVPAQLQAIAACESGGNPRAIGGGGLYRGKYQFDRQTWAAVGGSGDPAAAPEAEQDKRAAMLYARSGAAPWPVCGS